MHIEDFDYTLPSELIAHYPLPNRTDSRLLVVDSLSNEDKHSQFKDIGKFFKAGDLLVLNNTKVIQARLLGTKVSGGQVEVLVERVINDNQAWCHVRANRSPKAGTQLILENEVKATVIDRSEALFKLEFCNTKTVWQWLEEYGHMPLPPYIERKDEALDKNRYQTVYGQKQGAVAAPTAGLHFSEDLLEELSQNKIEIGYITLHVGAGTFQPVRVDNIDEHIMHAEHIEVDQALVEKIKQTKARGNKVIAVGTTVVRALESASQSGQIEPMTGDTSIFIKPGYEFKTIDAMVTNFHLPKSTLLMLVSAFSGLQRIQKAYQMAIDEKYRFFSYGDAMLLIKGA